MKHSKTKTSYYRRLYVAYLIDTGENTVSAIIQATSMHRRTVQDTILALADLDIECKFVGANKNGHYTIENWGAIDKNWIKSHLSHITDVLQYPKI